MQPAASDQRAAVRFDTEMPVRIDGAEGIARNISSTGIYFETDVRQELGALVNLTIEFSLHGQRQRLQCEGKVVRVDARDGRVGVAARLLAPFFAEPGTESQREDEALA